MFGRVPPASRSFETEIGIVNMERALAALVDIERADHRRTAYGLLWIPEEFCARHDEEALYRARLYRDRVRPQP